MILSLAASPLGIPHIETLREYISFYMPIFGSTPTNAPTPSPPPTNSPTPYPESSAVRIGFEQIGKSNTICMCLLFVFSFSASIPLTSFLFSPFLSTLSLIFFSVSLEGDEFYMQLIGDTTFLMSKIPLSYADSSRLCTTCFGLGLADVSKSVANVGSPYGEKVHETIRFVHAYLVAVDWAVRYRFSDEFSGVSRTECRHNLGPGWKWKRYFVAISL